MNWKKPVLILTFLASTLFCSNAYANENKKKIDPITLEDHFQAYYAGVVEEIGARNERLENFEEFKLLENLGTGDGSASLGFSEDFEHGYLSDEEQKKIHHYVAKILEKGGKRFIDNTGWLDEIENRFKQWFRYEIITGDKKRESDFPTLKEQDRLENERQKETTTFRFLSFLGKPLGPESHTGISPYIKHRDVGLKVYSRAKDFELFGTNFDYVKIQLNSQQEGTAVLRKILSPKWYSEIVAGTNNLSNIDEARIAFIKEISKEEKFVLDVGYTDDLGEFVMANWRKRF